MAPKKLTEYERKRLENIKRNEEMLAALKVHSKAAVLSAAAPAKRISVESKSYNASAKKQKPEAPIVVRRSQRTRGVPPESKGLADAFDDRTVKPAVSPPIRRTRVLGPIRMRTRVLGPIRMSDAFRGKRVDSNRKFIDTILGNSKKSSEGVSVKDESVSVKREWDFCKKEELEKSEIESSIDLGVSIKEEYDGVRDVKCLNLSDYGEVDSCSLDKDVVKSECLDGSEKTESENCVDLDSLCLKPENIARIMRGRITFAKFFPCTDMKMIAAGNRFGDISFWNVNSKDKDHGIYRYCPHSGPITGILVQQPTMSKVLTSCYDGYIRLMDVNKESFDLVHSSDETVFSLSQQANDYTSFYFGEGHGGLNIWDLRAGKSSTNYMLHEYRINTIDFNPSNPNIMATGSSDGTACIWDLRRINVSKPNAMRRVNHQKSVQAAYFSPSGSYLATTSFDNTVGVLGGTNFDDLSTVYHNNQTGRWISSFRAIWGWDDSYIFIGNMKRGIDVISTTQKRTVMTLKSEYMSTIPCRFSAHPYEVGTLAGATSGGQIYICTLS